MRAKMVVTEVRQHRDYTPVELSEKERPVIGESVKFTAVCKDGLYPESGLDEDNSYAKWSPSASLDIYIANPALFGKLSVGEKYYVDFTKANQ
jgi:hypothetical protein